MVFNTSCLHSLVKAIQYLLLISHFSLLNTMKCRGANDAPSADFIYKKLEWTAGETYTCTTGTVRLENEKHMSKVMLPCVVTCNAENASKLVSLLNLYMILCFVLASKAKVSTPFFLKCNRCEKEKRRNTTVV